MDWINESEETVKQRIKEKHGLPVHVQYEKDGTCRCAMFSVIGAWPEWYNYDCLFMDGKLYRIACYKVQEYVG